LPSCHKRNKSPLLHWLIPNAKNKPNWLSITNHVITVRSGILLTTCSLKKETKKATKKKILVDLRFLTSWTMTSENCTRAHVQQTSNIYIYIIYCMLLAILWVFNLGPKESMSWWVYRSFIYSCLDWNYRVLSRMMCMKNFRRVCICSDLIRIDSRSKPHSYKLALKLLSAFIDFHVLSESYHSWQFRDTPPPKTTLLSVYMIRSWPY